LVAVTTVGQVLPAFEPIGLLAPRRPSRGPQRLPVNKTAAAAGVMQRAQSSEYRLTIAGPRMLDLTLGELEGLPVDEKTLPIACVEGWSRLAHWRGPRLLDLVRQVGGSASSTVTVTSLQQDGYRVSTITGSQLEAALLATHLNNERLSLDHGYPVRLIAPDRAGVLQTKWLTRIEVRNA
jgi:DMSO/TMAO reductase YedYZ molybdopterin-dependent catalytic subunit